MKEKLKEKFLLSHYLQANFSKLHHLKKGSLSVEEYTREFEQLIIKCDLKEDAEQTLVRYLGGLDEKIVHIVELYPYTTLDELSSLAHKVELRKKARRKSEAFKPQNHTYTPQRASYTTLKPFNPANLKPPPLTVPKTAPQMTTKPKEIRRCFRCQGLGHIASECPNKSVVTQAEYQASFEEEMEEEKESYLNKALEEVEEGPDEGELLVVRRALSGLATQDGNEQREAIFHTSCTIWSKVCSLIIAGGSCTNVASKTLVDKLQLTGSRHPFPYTSQWLNQGKGIQVSSRCLVSLGIRKNYKDEI